MTDMLNTLLNFFRLDSGKEQANAVPFRLKNVIEILQTESATGYAGRRQPCNLVDIGAIGSAKTALQATAGPFSQNRLLLGHTSSSSVRNHCRGEVGLTPPDEDCGYQESQPTV